MKSQNRVLDYYETACDFLSLPIYARYLIGTHFKITRDQHMVFSNRDAMDEEIFTEVFKRNIYAEFKKFTHHYKKSRSHEYFLN